MLGISTRVVTQGYKTIKFAGTTLNVSVSGAIINGGTLLKPFPHSSKGCVVYINRPGQIGKGNPYSISYIVNLAFGTHFFWTNSFYNGLLKQYERMR